MKKAAVQSTAARMNQLLNELANGNIKAIGVAAVHSSGLPAYFYFDGTPQADDTLTDPINKMIGLYAERKMFAGNAPATNRSYGIH